MNSKFFLLSVYIRSSRGQKLFPSHPIQNDSMLQRKLSVEGSDKDFEYSIAPSAICQF